MPTEDREDILTLLSGSTKSFEVELQDENDEPEDLTGATDASLRIVLSSKDPSGTVILDRSKTAFNLAIGTGKLVASFPVPADADLPAGRFIGQVAVEINGAWFHSDWFPVVIKPKIAPTS